MRQGVFFYNFLKVGANVNELGQTSSGNEIFKIQKLGDIVEMIVDPTSR